MANPVANLQRTAAEYKAKDQKDKRRFWIDLVLNNALYILMLAFCIYTAIQRPNFLTLGSLGNLIVQVAAYLPMALGIAGCIVLTGTDLSAGRAVGLTAAITGAFLQRIDYPNKMLAFLPENDLDAPLMLKEATNTEIPSPLLDALSKKPIHTDVYGKDKHSMAEAVFSFAIG